MKRLLSVFLALSMLACLSACGVSSIIDKNWTSALHGIAAVEQAPEYTVTRSYYFDENGDWEKTCEYIRDENGDVRVALLNGLLDTVYDYDDEGREICETDYDSDGITVKDVFETAYDEAGNIISESHPQGDSLYAESFYTYDENGYLTRVEKSNNLGGYNYYDYINDPDGRVTEIQYLQKDGGMGCFSKWEYAADGSAIEYYFADSQYNSSIPTIETTGLSAVTCDNPIAESRYDTNGLCVYSERYDQNYTIESTYDDNGKLVEELETYADGSRLHTTYTRSESGKLLEKYTEDSFGNWTREFHEWDAHDTALKSGYTYYYADVSAIGQTGGLKSYYNGAVGGEEVEVLDYINEVDEEGHILHHTDYWPDDEQISQYDGENYNEWSNADGDRLCTLAEADAFCENSGELSYDEVKDLAMDYIHRMFSEDISEKDVLWSGITCAWVDYVGGAYIYHVAFYIPGFGAGSVLINPYGECLDASTAVYADMVKYLYRVYRDAE